MLVRGGEGRASHTLVGTEKAKERLQPFLSKTKPGNVERNQSVAGSAQRVGRDKHGPLAGRRCGDDAVEGVVPAGVVAEVVVVAVVAAVVVVVVVLVLV